MDKPTKDLGSDVSFKTVYYTLVSCDGDKVKELLKQVYFEMLDMNYQNPHYRFGLFRLNIVHSEKKTPKAFFRLRDGKDDEPNTLAPWFEEKRGAEMVEFRAVHVGVKRLIHSEDKVKDEKKLDPVILHLQNLGQFQFTYTDYHGGRPWMTPTKRYTLPLPEEKETKPIPCIMLTNDMHHTTICWKVVKVGNYNTLAIAHLNVEGYRYKHFHNLVKQYAHLEVADAQGQVQLMKIYGCWGPADYFAKSLKRKRTLGAGGSCVVVGVWDSSTGSWQLYVQVRRKGDVVKRAFRLISCGWVKRCVGGRGKRAATAHILGGACSCGAWAHGRSCTGAVAWAGFLLIVLRFRLYMMSRVVFELVTL